MAWHGSTSRSAGTRIDPSTTTQEKTPRRPTRRRSGKELVERIRREIAAGTYDTQEKWEAALDRLLDRLDQKS